VWGWAEPGETVVVEFAGQRVEPSSADDGRWRAQLEPLSMSKQGRTMTARGSSTVTLRDVLVGDVWLASGQSNMAMSARKSIEWAEAKRDAADPLLRVFTVSPTGVSPLKPLDDCRGAWAPADEQTAGNVTAAGYYMARKLRQDLDVPIGLIDSAWGGTLAEFWTSREALTSTPKTEPLWATYKARVIGQSVRWLARPARDSDTRCISSMFADPVRRKWPGWRRRSMARLTARRSSGSRWTSSKVIGWRPPTRASGSRRAASTTSRSSSERKRRDPATSSCARVLFPVWRAPVTTTAGMTRSRSRRLRSTARGRNLFTV